MFGEKKLFFGMHLFYKRHGFLLFERLVVLSIIGILMTCTIPRLSCWYEKRTLELAAGELAQAIRETQIASKNERSDMRHYAEGLIFRCFMKDGYVVYQVEKGSRVIYPKGRLPKGIALASNGTAPAMVFKRDAFAGRSRIYTYRLFSKEHKYGIRVVCAMYTGRIQIIKEY